MSLHEMFDTALQNPETADFAALRQAYATSPEHDPYARKGELPAAMARLQEAFLGQDDRRIAEALEAVLRLNPALINQHMDLVVAYDRLGDIPQAMLHAHFVDGWLQALIATGDGQSMETAFTVLSLDEEYALLKASGWKLVSQRLAEENGHVFDVFEARQPKDGTLAVVCFNIDLITQSIQEGRGVLPSSGRPEVHLDVTQPGRNRLRVELGFDTDKTVGTVRTLTTRYLEGIGYQRMDDSHFRRGSRLGSLTSLSPRGWQAVVTTEITHNHNDVSIQAFYDVNTFGQQVIPPEVDFWKAEAAGLANAILTGRIDTQTPVAYAGRARRVGIIIIALVVAGLVLTILLSLLIPAVFERWLPGLTEPLAGLSSDNPIVVGVFLLAIAAYLVFYFLRRRSQKQ